MTIKDLFKQYPAKAICWASACDWLAGGTIIRDLCSEDEKNLEVMSHKYHGDYIHAVLES